jgi:hypothetical protein
LGKGNLSFFKGQVFFKWEIIKKKVCKNRVGSFKRSLKSWALVVGRGLNRGNNLLENVLKNHCFRKFKRKLTNIIGAGNLL